MKYYLRVNKELDGWDVIEKDGIETDIGYGDCVIATFYEKGRALDYYTHLLNEL